ncbi:unnamed protein product [Mytilus coruscus]|uniref:Mutator-like transposase domain-containing protein n=1 Tax=Mytilus coruscus TaxID=42192 RepID=A0A6J8BK98_MYTCO|nr:unnamed protein product [Mytilus coruscus]
MKMYKEIANCKPGPNPGQRNVALASALQDCPIGNTTVQQLLAVVDTPPPCRSIYNRVAAEMVKLNKTDMAQKLELVKDVNRKRGVPESEINITVDARYDSNTIVSKKKPDEDGHSAKGMEDTLTALEPMWKVERLADPVHLGESQFRASLRAQYSAGMFHGKAKEENRQLKTVFSKDLHDSK